MPQSKSSHVSAPGGVAYQGVPGSFSHLAGMRYFGEDALMLGGNRFETLFKMVRDGEASHAIIPVENSLAGSVHENYDLLFRYNVFVTGEQYLKVEHHLMALPMKGIGTKERLAAIKRVYSHPKAFEQCLMFFEEHPWIEKSVFSDTGGAARNVFQTQDPHSAAIASSQAASLYGLDIVRANIEDNPNNYTRFLIVEGERGDNPRANKCSLIFSLPHTPGSLFRAMKVLADHSVNVTKLESRPIMGKPFQYRFHVDIDLGEVGVEGGKRALADLESVTEDYKLLGFYEAASYLRQAGQ